MPTTSILKSTHHKTIDESKGLNRRLVFAISAVALGSAFQHGYNLGVINAPLQLMSQWLNETHMNKTGKPLEESDQTIIISWIVSLYCVGGMIGGALTGLFSERFGRKKGLLMNNAFSFFAALFFGLCKIAASWEMIAIGRLLIGINSGLGAGLAPMYLAEISPTRLRGAICTVYQLVVTISILFSQLMGLDSILGNEAYWPLLLALTALAAVWQTCTLPLCPESPKYLLINRDQQIAAQRALSWLRCSPNIYDELEEIMGEAEAQKLVPSVSIREIFMNPALRIPLIISIVMMLAQQFSGINAAIFFSTMIYDNAGLNEAESLYATIAMGSMNVLMTVVSLVLVEKAGRKTLMLVGLCGMLVDTILLTICLSLQSDSARWLSYASIVLVILFVVMFATGPGSIPWFLVNELFASNARPTASSIAVAVNWTAAFLVGVGFLPVQSALGPFVFLIFTGLLILFILFTIYKVPETKGRSIDEITAVFKQKAYGEPQNTQSSF